MAERGEHPLLLAKMESGYAVLADTQFLPGYCILLASGTANHLTDLALPERLNFLRDMSLIGEVLMDACSASGLRRVNYEILGNTDGYLHAHIIPRYEDEPDEHKFMPAFTYPKDRWTDPQYKYDPSLHGVLRSRLTAALTNRIQIYDDTAID